MDTLDEQVNEVFSSTTTDGTKNVYFGAITRFVRWWWGREDCRHLFVDSFVSFVDEHGFSTALVKEWLKKTPFVSPIHLERLDYNDFCRFLVAQTRANGEGYSKSVYGSMRSACLLKVGRL
jgi:hypothetical protein